MSYQPKTYRKQGGDEFVVASGGAITVEEGAALNIAGTTAVTKTSASTNGSSSVESMVVSTTMTGAGGVGGRARFQLDTNVALGGWANALKAQTDFGAAGAVTGLGSALVAEMTLSPGTEAGGTYGVLELELNAPADSGGSNVAFIYASMQGADDDALDDAVSVLSLNGVTAGAGSVFNTFSPIEDAQVQARLKIKVNGDVWYIPLMDNEAGE
jgi:hypothetical protein